MAPPIVEAHGLTKRFGKVEALAGLDLVAHSGQVVAVLGPNGAGKTTTLRAISAMVKTGGSIRFAGQSIERKATEQIVAMGIAHVPEGRGTFVDLTVEENLRIGMYARRDKRNAGRDMDRVLELFPILGQRRRQNAGTLSGGEQQMLAVARALMLGPRLLLLDEPSLGLAPLVVREIFRILRTINEESRVSILLVEQNASIALDLADHVFLMETGRVVLAGTSDVLRRDDSIRRSYLGY